MKKVSGIILALIMCLCCSISMIALAHDSSAIKDEAGLIDDDKEYELAGTFIPNLPLPPLYPSLPVPAVLPHRSSVSLSAGYPCIY